MVIGLAAPAKSTETRARAMIIGNAAQFLYDAGHTTHAANARANKVHWLFFFDALRHAFSLLRLKSISSSATTCVKLAFPDAMLQRRL